MPEPGSKYVKGLDGEYRPQEGLLGSAQGQVKRSMLTGDPVPARDWMGNQRVAADGTPLYEASQSVDEKAALALGAVGGIFLLTLLGVVFAAVTGWYMPTLIASIRHDARERRLSSTTVGYGLPVLALITFLIALAAGGGPTAPAWFIAAIAVGAALFSAIGWVPMRFGRSLRGYEKGRGGWAVIGWMIGSLLLGFMVIAAMSPQYTYEGANALFSVMLRIGAPVSFVAGLVFGLLGEPDLLRPLVVTLRERAASGSSPPDA